MIEMTLKIFNTRLMWPWVMKLLVDIYLDIWITYNITEREHSLMIDQAIFQCILSHTKQVTRYTEITIIGYGIV